MPIQFITPGISRSVTMPSTPVSSGATPRINGYTSERSPER